MTCVCMTSQRSIQPFHQSATLEKKKSHCTNLVDNAMTWLWAEKPGVQVPAEARNSSLI